MDLLTPLQPPQKPCSALQKASLRVAEVVPGGRGGPCCVENCMTCSTQPKRSRYRSAGPHSPCQTSLRRAHFDIFGPEAQSSSDVHAFGNGGAVALGSALQKCARRECGQLYLAVVAYYTQESGPLCGSC